MHTRSKIYLSLCKVKTTRQQWSGQYWGHWSGQYFKYWPEVNILNIDHQWISKIWTTSTFYTLVETWKKFEQPERNLNTYVAGNVLFSSLFQKRQVLCKKGMERREWKRLNANLSLLYTDKCHLFTTSIVTWIKWIFFQRTRGRGKGPRQGKRYDQYDQ